MNERIRELYLKSLSDNQEFCYQKFAELTVLEVLNVQENLISNGHNAWHLHKPTKKHFGIGE